MGGALKISTSWEIEYEEVRNWLPPRDSNPDMLLQRQLSYH
jgi:hypothetical protein